MEVNPMMRLTVIVFGILCCLAVLVSHSNAEINPTSAVSVWLFNETDGDTASEFFFVEIFKSH